MRKLKLEELGRLSVDEYRKVDKIPVVVILDNIRSMHNVGSVFRTSDAFAIEKIFLCGITAKPPHKEIRKTAIGATESVEWEYASDGNKLVHSLKNKGYTILSVEQVEGSIHLDKFTINKKNKYAIILGNEVEGVQQSMIDESTFCLEIPQSGTKHSLNISVCTGIVLWKFYKIFK